LDVKTKVLSVVVLLLCANRAGGPVRAQERGADQATDASIALFLNELEQALQGGNAAAFLALHTGAADRHASTSFAECEALPGSSRGVVRERDREALPGSLPGNGYRLIVDVFEEFGQRARAATWRLDVKRIADASAKRQWAIVEEETVSSVENLFRL